jgi:hypothetical protein
MYSLFDRKAWTPRPRRLEAALAPLVSLIFVALRRRRSFFRRIITNCNVACFIECWMSVAKGKLIDTNSPLAGQINNAVEYYLTKAVYERGEFGKLERLLLDLQYALWFARDIKKSDESCAQDFAAEHDLVPIFEKYANLYNYVCFTASKEIEKLEIMNNEPASVEYWRSKVRFDILPRPLNEKTKARAVRKLFAALVRNLKLGFARANYLKIDFSLSDLTGVVALCGTLLLVLGYLRIFILGVYFGFPFQNYFGLADYLATSLNLTGQVLFGAVLAAAFGYASIATSNSYSVQQTELQTSSTQARVSTIGYHFLGVSSLPVVLLAYFRLGYFDTISAYVALIYVGMFATSRLSVAFFENPTKAYITMSMVYFSFSGTLTGAFGEIDRINHPHDGSSNRVLQLDNVRYDEKEWQIIAFTTDYIIMRNRTTKQILVRSRKELKSIEAS